MSDIPSELYREILKRVPVESLLRFRSVCKAWCCIIDDPNFAKSHFNRGLGSDYLMISRNTDNVKGLLLPLSHMISRPKTLEATTLNITPRLQYLPVPSCNGLILRYHKTHTERVDGTSIDPFTKLICARNKTIVNWFVSNPFTGESSEIRRCDEFPACIIPYAGIGYDEANDDYKVFFIFLRHTYVYSLGLNYWRRIGDFPDSVMCMEDGVFANGALYWVGYRAIRERCIITLDLCTETYRNCPLPLQVTNYNTYGLRLCVLGGSLFLSCYYFRGFYVVWMFKGYETESNWVKVLTLQLEDHSDIIELIAYLKIKEQVVFHCNKNKFFLYEMEKNFLMEVFDFNMDSNEETSGCVKDFSGFQVFTASLVRVNRTGGANERVASEGMSGRKRKRAPGR